MRQILKIGLVSLVIALTASAVRAATLGIVMVHGKQGRGEQFLALAGAFDQLGWLTERPDMCWSSTRIYDRSYLDCLSDIDAAVARLKQRGATDIVLIGMSLGSNGVLGYGARHDNVAGIIALAPAHAPEFISHRPEIAESLQKARSLIAQGRGDEKERFADVNTGEGTSNFNFTVATTAKIYESFFAPDSPAVMPTNAARLKSPLLVVSGTNDPTQRGARAIFARAPSHPLNRFVSVDATHRGTPAAGREAMLSWIRELATR